MRKLNTFLKSNYICGIRKLPVWLNVKVEDGMLHLWGIPPKEDIGQIMIEIIDTSDLVLREFLISVYGVFKYMNVNF